jgi:hypothetical protein
MGRVKRLSPSELDEIGLRLEELGEEEERLRSQVKEQIENFGSIPPRAEKSRRLETETFSFTLSTAIVTQIKDAEVERIKEACPASIFDQLFIAITKYKLTKGATMVLSATLPQGSPPNLRKMFSQAVTMTESAPQLRIKRLAEVEAEPA